MRIQEMKSGFLHLKKKVEDQRPENYFTTHPSRDPSIKSETERGLPLASDCELDEPCWSVVSFEKMEAGGLTYNQAVSLLFELDARDVSGLCIVTDEAAKRIKK